MSSPRFEKGANRVLLILAIAGILFGIKYEGILAISILKTVCWVILGAWIGLTAYLGQREITKEQKTEYARVKKRYADNLFQANKKKENLEQENRKLKQKLENK